MSKKITVAFSVLVIAALLVSCAPTATQTSNTIVATATQAPATTIQMTTVDEQTAFEQIYAAVNPSVVDIVVTEKSGSTTTSTQYNFPNLPGFPDFNNQQPQQSTPTQVEGAGFIIDSAGHIVTNNHVVADASKIVVTFSDGTQVEAKLTGTDPDTDLAVIQVTGVDASLIKPIALGDSTQEKVGAIVVAIGSPFQLQGTMTSGIISALGRTMQSTSASSSNSSSSQTGYYSIPDIIQTDAAINHGNSGGPLVNLSGEVIGVNTAIESTSDSNAGIGYAIPSAIVKLVTSELISSGKADHTYLGVSTTQMTADLATAMNLPTNTRGILLEAVSANGPAGKAGLKSGSQQITIDGADYAIGGDIINSIDGNPIKTYNDLVSYLLLKTKVGQQVTIGYLRDGKQATAKVTLEARPASS
jgi:Trypsin-like serine proteases, typically periplasmic, contain C-terminal PDZ domain